MSLIGGPGQSSSKTTNNQTSTNFANYNTGSAPASNLNLSGVSTGKKGTLNLSIESSDYGAIDAGAKLANAALNYGDSANTRAIEALQQTSQSVIDKSLSIASKNQVSEGAQLQQNLLYAALIGAAAFVLIKVVK